jgi:hypothetical protein
MLCGMGIDRSRIDAMITKTARADAVPAHVPKPGNANLADVAERIGRRA